MKQDGIVQAKIRWRSKAFWKSFFPLFGLVLLFLFIFYSPMYIGVHLNRTCGIISSLVVIGAWLFAATKWKLLIRTQFLFWLGMLALQVYVALFLYIVVKAR